MKFIVVSTLLIILTGCGATGPRYSEHQSSVPSLDENRSRVVFFRNSRFMSGGADAEIHINDTKVGECADSAYFYADVDKGPVTIKADNSGTPGTHAIDKDLEGGAEYYYEILVNESYVSSGVILGLIGQAVYVGSNDNVSGWIFKEVTKKEAATQLHDKIFSLDGE